MKIESLGIHIETTPDVHHEKYSDGSTVVAMFEPNKWGDWMYILRSPRYKIVERGFGTPMDALEAARAKKAETDNG